MRIHDAKKRLFRLCQTDGQEPTGAKRGSRSALQGSPLPLQRKFWPSATSAPGNARQLLRPVTRLMTATTRAITSNRWIRPPATWNPQPKSQRIMRIAKIVQSIDTPSNRKTYSATTKGEKRHLHAELSLECIVFRKAGLGPAAIPIRVVGCAWRRGACLVNERFFGGASRLPHPVRGCR